MASAQQMSSAEQSKIQLMQEMEIEMMSDLYNRMTQACHKKCIQPKYGEPDLGNTINIIRKFTISLNNSVFLF